MVALSHGRDICINTSPPPPRAQHTGLGNILEEGEERMYDLVFSDSSVARSTPVLSEIQFLAPVF